MLENTGDDPVANLEITVTLLDSEGMVVSSDTDNVHLIQPGQKMGLGDEPYENIAEVAEIDVQASVPSYASDAEELGEITTEGIGTSDESSRWKTTFTAKSTYEVQIDSPYAYVIYRNTGGDIVGGSYGFMNVLPPGAAPAARSRRTSPSPGSIGQDRGLRRPGLHVLGGMPWPVRACPRLRGGGRPATAARAPRATATCP